MAPIPSISGIAPAGGNIFFDGGTGGAGPFNWEFTNGNGGTDVIPYKTRP